jgi:hypothetical protein
MMLKITRHPVSEFVFAGFGLERHPAVLRNGNCPLPSGRGRLSLVTDFEPCFPFFFPVLIFFTRLTF